MVYIEINLSNYDDLALLMLSFKVESEITLRMLKEKEDLTEEERILFNKLNELSSCRLKLNKS